VNARIKQRATLNGINAQRDAMMSRAAQLRSSGQSDMMGVAMMTAPLYAMVSETGKYERELARIDALGLGAWWPMPTNTPAAPRSLAIPRATWPTPMAMRWPFQKHP
jgi:hypothetical protein